MKIIKICCMAVGAGSLLTTTDVFAQVIGYGTLNIAAPAYSATGDQAGPYTISSLTGNFGTGTGFGTFCVGTEVNYTPGSYNYQISSTVQPSSGTSGPSGGLSYVALGTAYLYSQFRAGNVGYNGNITSYASGSSFTTDIEKNDGLQAAIWYLQKQPNYNANSSGAPTGTQFNNIQFWANGSDVDGLSSSSAAYSYFLTYLNDAEAYASGGTSGTLTSIADAEASSHNAFGVYSLNLYTGSYNGASTDWAQPQLTVVPEASTVYAGASLLLPFGMSAFRIIRKKCVTA
jgi:hypothetical protein